MIEVLRIRDLAVVADAELEFGPGLNVLTGETGAGKSLVLGALELLAGGRASADRVRAGADQAVVEAVFRTEGQPDLEAELAERGLRCEDHELVVRRTLAAGGRSRVQVAGQLSPVSLLGELLGERLEISSQHESQALRRPEVHGRLLDAFGGLLGRREAVARAHAALREAQGEMERLRAAAEDRARRQDFLAFQVREIDEAKVQVGELAELQAERARLQHAERLCGDAARAAASLGGDPAVSDAPGAADLVGEAARRVEELAAIDPRLGELAGRLASSHAELTDAAGELARYAEGIEAEPGRLAELEDRLETLERLQRKYGATAEDILAFRDQAARELEDATHADARLEELEGRRRELADDLAKKARSLSAGRRKAARALASEMHAALGGLALPHAALEVDLDACEPPADAPCGPGGAESPQLLFRANPGEEPRPLRRVASGGELSRLFLALKNALRRAEGGMVLVFDEVDTGVGGGVAEQVGRTLFELAAEHQVLCITHLPQIAALGDVHFRVEKREEDGRAAATVRRLSEAERVDEVARMAAGARIGAATRRHAEELLRARPSR